MDAGNMSFVVDHTNYGRRVFFVWIKQGLSLYDHPSQAEPYLASISIELKGLAASFVEDSRSLLNRVRSEAADRLSQSTTQANALYSNWLEGELREEYIQAHEESEASMACANSCLGSAVLLSLHRDLFTRVGDCHVAPGVIRHVNVKIQQHIPPSWESVPEFLRRSDEVYLQKTWNLEELIIVAAAAHHRLQWIHPFSDGNGRAVRLQSQLALRPLASTYWSLSRGLWHRKKEYYQMLAMADSARLSDIDGRGNLSQACLTEWTKFFISVCHGEILMVIESLDDGMQ